MKLEILTISCYFVESEENEKILTSRRTKGSFSMNPALGLLEPSTHVGSDSLNNLSLNQIERLSD